MTTSDPRAELDELQQQLATRQSTTCFAHAAVSLVVSLIFAGAAGKLFWDSVKLPYLGIAAALVSLGLVAYSFTQYVKGRAHLRTELQRFDRLQDLMRTLGIHDPAGLLPSR